MHGDVTAAIGSEPAEGARTWAFSAEAYDAFNDMVKLFLYQDKNVAVSICRTLLKKSTQQYLDDTASDWRLHRERLLASQNFQISRIAGLAPRRCCTSRPLRHRTMGNGLFCLGRKAS